MDHDPYVEQQLERAVLRLACGEEDLKGRLERAQSELRMSLPTVREKLPDDLRSRFDSILERSISKMSLEECGAVSRQIVGLWHQYGKESPDA